jgi:hypothetical protein
MREEDDDKEPEQRGEKRQHWGANEETSSNIHHPEESDHSHKTNEKDAEDCRKICHWGRGTPSANGAMEVETQRIPEKERTARAKRKLAGGDEMKSHVTGPAAGPPLHRGLLSYDWDERTGLSHEHHWNISARHLGQNN